VVGMSRTEFCGTSGIGALVNGHKRAQASVWKMRSRRPGSEAGACLVRSEDFMPNGAGFCLRSLREPAGDFAARRRICERRAVFADVGGMV
jgi:hypothetical protein